MVPLPPAVATRSLFAGNVGGDLGEGDFVGEVLDRKVSTPCTFTAPPCTPGTAPGPPRSAAVHSWNTRNVPRRFALLAGFVMVGVWAKASTKWGFATKQAARQPLKRARARPMSE